MLKKEAILFLLLVITGAKIFSQPGTFLKIYSGYPNRVAISVAEIPGGNFIAISPGATSIIFKTDSTGNIILTNSLCNNLCKSLRNTKDSNYVFTATTYPLCPNWGMHEDILVCKIDSNLDTLWVKSYGTLADERGICVRQLENNSFVLGGYAIGSDNFYKLDSAGNIIWNHWVPLDFVNSIIQDSEGNFILCGYVDGFLNSWSVVKTDSIGANILWAKYYGTTGGGGGNVL